MLSASGQGRDTTLLARGAAKRPKLELHLVSAMADENLIDDSVLCEKDIEVIARYIHAREHQDRAVFHHVTVIVKDLLMIDVLDTVGSTEQSDHLRLRRLALIDGRQIILTERHPQITARKSASARAS